MKGGDDLEEEWRPNGNKAMTAEGPLVEAHAQKRQDALVGAELQNAGDEQVGEAQKLSQSEEKHECL